MKTKMATALSLIGVLGAGSAAALVNTEILDSGSAAATSSALVAPAEVPADDTGLLDEVNAAPQAAQPGTESSSDPGPTSLPAVPSQPTTFDVGDAGSVTLEVQGGRLTIVSASANSGWTVTKTEEDSDGDEIEVYFETANVQVEFEARLSNGQIVPSVDATSLGSKPSAPPAAPPAPGPASGDDDDDDMDEDDHDDMDDGDDDDMDEDDHDDMDEDDHHEDDRDDD